MACNSSRRVLLASPDLLGLRQDSTTRAAVPRCFSTRRCPMKLTICAALLRSMLLLASLGGLGSGLWLARSNRALTPDELARALSRGCAAVPTVVIVSACYSGSFATGKMASSNRIVLTAARQDRPSFGCQPHRTYNFFDECLLGVLPQAPTWHSVSDGADRCVRRMEHALGLQPSEPQAYFGGTVVALKVGF